MSTYSTNSEHVKCLFASSKLETEIKHPRCSVTPPLTPVPENSTLINKTNKEMTNFALNQTHYISVALNKTYDMLPIYPNIKNKCKRWLN